MSDSGNDVQVRIVAEQLFDTWRTNQEREAKERRRWIGGNFGSWLGAIALAVTTIIAWANAYNLAASADARSRTNETNIAAIKADTSDRLARIETKIDYLMAEGRK